MIAGVELRKERRLSEVLTDAFNILFAHWKPLVIISVPLLVASVAFGLVTLALTPDWLTSDEFADRTEFTDEELEDLAPLVIVGLAYLPVAIVVYQLVGAAGVVFLDETDRGRSVSPGDALDRAQERLGTLIGAVIRSAAIILLFAVTIVGIPFAINRAVRWIFLSQVVMLDGKRGQEVLAGSSDLVKGRWWNTFLRLIVTTLVIAIPVNILAQALVSASPGVLGTVLSSLTVFITAAYGIISLSLMYFDLKTRKAAHDSISLDREPPTEPEPPRQSQGYL